MPWDTSMPADSTLLRLTPGVIRPNWTALETGGVPFDALQLQEQAADPASAANTGFLYSKQVNSRTEAFYEKDNGTVTQLTGLNVVTNGTNYGITTPWGLRMNWGTVVVAISGPTSTVITFAVAFTSTPQAIQVSRQRDPNSLAIPTVHNAPGPTNAGFTFVTGSSNLATLTAYYFAIGV